jgi:hypothetical protein
MMGTYVFGVPIAESYVLLLADQDVVDFDQGVLQQTEEQEISAIDLRPPSADETNKATPVGWRPPAASRRDASPRGAAHPARARAQREATCQPTVPRNRITTFVNPEIN